MARLAACPTVDSNPEFLRFVDMADQFKKLEVKVLMSGDADETSDLLGDEIFSEDVSRPGEVSVSFDAGSLGLSLRAVESGEGSAARRVEAPAVVLGFTGRGGQAEISKVISKGDFVSRVGGVSVMPGAYADIIHMLKTAPRPIVVHFVKVSLFFQTIVLFAERVYIFFIAHPAGLQAGQACPRLFYIFLFDSLFQFSRLIRDRTSRISKWTSPRRGRLRRRKRQRATSLR